jgi:hypothetical protein
MILLLLAKGFQETKQDFGGIESETIALSADLKTMFLWFLLLEWGIEKKSTSVEELPICYLRKVSAQLERVKSAYLLMSLEK